MAPVRVQCAVAVHHARLRQVCQLVRHHLGQGYGTLGCHPLEKGALLGRQRKGAAPVGGYLEIGLRAAEPCADDDLHRSGRFQICRYVPVLGSEFKRLGSQLYLERVQLRMGTVVDHGELVPKPAVRPVIELLLSILQASATVDRDVPDNLGETSVHERFYPFQGRVHRFGVLLDVVRLLRGPLVVGRYSSAGNGRYKYHHRDDRERHRAAFVSHEFVLAQRDNNRGLCMHVYDGNVDIPDLLRINRRIPVSVVLPFFIESEQS